MGFDDGLRLGGFLVGAALHGLLLAAAVRHRSFKASVVVFRALLAAAFAWHLGNFVVEAARQAGWLPLLGWAGAVAYAGLSFLPPLLVHAVLAQRRELTGRGPRALFTAALYLPLVYLPWPMRTLIRPPYLPPMAKLEPLLVVFIVWFVAALLHAAYLAYDVARRVEGPRLPRLYRWAARVFVALAVLMAYVYLLGGRFGPGGYTLETLAMLSSIVPSLVFAYFVYRYRVLGYMLRESFVSLVLLAAVAAVYLFGVREAARQVEAWAGVPATLVEAAGLLALVLAYEPASRTLSAAARRALGGETERVTRAARRGGEALTRAVSAREVALALDDALGRELGLVGVHVLAARPAGGELRAGAPALYALLRHEVLVSRRQTDDPAALEELDALGAEAAFGLRSPGGLVGALVLGKLGDGGSLADHQLERLLPLADAAALALENAAQVDARMALERRAARSERMAALGYLAATIVHEVKNPLGAIKTVAQVMRSEVRDETSRRDLDQILGGVERMRATVDRLLTLGRPEPAQSTACDLGSLLDRVRLALEPQLKQKAASFEVRLGPGAPAVLASGEALWEVFYNLAANSLEAMAAGGRIDVVRAAGDGDVLRVLFKDDGPGIPAELGSGIFDPYVTGRGDGHGLGLAIVRMRMEEMGGSVALEPSEKGACFMLCFPPAGPR